MSYTPLHIVISWHTPQNLFYPAIALGCVYPNSDMKGQLVPKAPGSKLATTGVFLVRAALLFPQDDVVTADTKHRHRNYSYLNQGKTKLLYSFVWSRFQKEYAIKRIRFKKKTATWSINNTKVNKASKKPLAGIQLGASQPKTCWQIPWNVMGTGSNSQGIKDFRN